MTEKFELLNKSNYDIQEVINLFEKEFGIAPRSFYRHHRNNMEFISVTPKNIRIARADLLYYIQKIFKKTEKS